MKACSLLTEDKATINHIYISTINGKQMLCAGKIVVEEEWLIESLTLEKAEEIIMNAIENGNGCVARNVLIRKMGMPVAVCESLISVR